MIPTARRNNTSILFVHRGAHILIDCAEGTQRQMRIAKIPPTKISLLLITHWHSDHVLGLPGLFQTLAASGYQKTLTIYGPIGTKKRVENLLALFFLKEAIKTDIKEISTEGEFLTTEELQLSAYSLRHPIPCLGYTIKEKDKRKINLDYMKKFDLTRHPLLGKLQRGADIKFKGHLIKAETATILIPGKKISFMLDTAQCDNCYKLADNATILVSEATHMHELEEKAKKYRHLTAKLAATIAKQANTKKLILTHFSQRYEENISALEKEAKEVFENTVCAYDFFKVKT